MSEVVTRKIADTRRVHIDCAGVGVLINSRRKKFEPDHGLITMHWDSVEKKMLIGLRVSGFMIKADGTVGKQVVSREFQDGDPDMPTEFQKAINEHRMTR